MPVSMSVTRARSAKSEMAAMAVLRNMGWLSGAVFEGRAGGLGARRRLLRCSRRLSGANHGEVDIGFGDVVDEVRQKVLRDDGDDLDDLRVAETGVPHRRKIRLAHLAAGCRDLRREANGGVGLRVTRSAFAVQCDFFGRYLREVDAEIGMRR